MNFYGLRLPFLLPFLMLEMIGCESALVESSSAPIIMTVRGPIPADSLGISLPHEHVMVDFIGADSVNKERYNPDSVLLKAMPYLEDLPNFGVTALFECTPAYLGRDPLVLKSLSEATGLHLITNTGYYGTRGGKFLPQHAFTESAEQLADRWIQEWDEGIEGTGIRPGFIKISVNEDSLSDEDRKLVQAAAITHRKTGLTIGSHTTSGSSVIQVMDLLEEYGVAPEAFIWIHAQTVEDSLIHKEMAERGCWIEFDGISDATASLDLHREWAQRMLDWGHLDQLLLSHDAGWYHVGEINGGTYRGYTSLFTKLIPRLENAGFSQAQISQILVENPASAFAIQVRSLK